MKYTKEQLDGMHNDDISKLLCALLGFNVQNFVFEGVVTIEQMGKVSTFDMMDWSDIMPLAVEHGVLLGHSDWFDCYSFASMGKFVAHESKADINHDMIISDSCHWFSDNIPQRAIACCLILVLQEQQQ